MQKRKSKSPTSVDETFVDADSDDPEPERASAAPDPLIGATLLDTYEIDRLMGEGGMGRIYEARHLRIGKKRFAIKVLRPELVTSAQIRGRFEREVEAVARLTHPAVVAIADVGTTPQGLPFMVCEHLSGLDLLAYTRRFGALSDARVVHMGCRVAEALEAAHAQGVIHRDIKPSNVFLLGAFVPLGPEWDRVKVIDFGLSRVVGRDDMLTETGVVLGTPAYMSPEQARGLRTDHRTDVYGVGAVLYAAATGVPPFREKTPQQTLIAVMSRDPVRPRDINPAISEELELIIQRALSKHPHERYPSMSALRLALSNLEQHGPTATSATAVRRRASGLRGVRVRYLALASCAALLFAAATINTVAGLIPSDGGFRFTAAERVAVAGIAAAAVVFAVRWLGRFRREVWHNTAKLSDGLPRLRVPVFWALVVYALASFAIRFGDDVLPHFAPGMALARPPELWSGWGAVLSLGALLTALVVALHQSWWQPMRPGRRWLWGPLLAAGMALACLAVGRWALLERSAQDLARAARELAIRGGQRATAATSTASSGEAHGHSLGSASPSPRVASVASDAGSRDAAAGYDGGASGRAAPRAAEQLAALPGTAPPDATDAEPGLPIVPADGLPLAPSPAPTGSAPATSSPPPVSSAAGAAAAGSASAAPAASGSPITSSPAAPSVGARGPASPAPPASEAPITGQPGTAAPGAAAPSAPARGSAPAAPGMPSSSSSLTVSVARDAEAMKSAGTLSSGDREALRVEILLHARRASGLDEAVLSIERLLGVAPEMARDAELRRILVRAAANGGETARAAFRVMTSSMGSDGPDLLYQIMTERPSLAEQAKFLLSRSRVRKLFSPELAIAYDLRFSPSCSARRGLLKRASEIGDQRTINTLSALLDNPSHCGQPGRFPCLELCTSEELYFKKTIDTIVRRVRGNDRAASMN